VAQRHLKGEPVSEKAYVFSVKAYVAQGAGAAPQAVPSEAGRPVFLYRVDATAPTIPSAPTVQSDKLTSGLVVNWGESSDPESAVSYYEVQERVDTHPVWKTAAMVTARTLAASSSASE